MTPNANIEIISGASLVFGAVVKKDGVPTNITGGTAWFTAKVNYADSDADAFFQISSLTGGIILQDPLNGVISGVVPSTATVIPKWCGELVLMYDLKLQLANGEIHYLSAGQIIIKQRVTEAP